MKNKFYQEGCGCVEFIYDGDELNDSTYCDIHRDKLIEMMDASSRHREERLTILLPLFVSFDNDVKDWKTTSLISVVDARKILKEKRESVGNLEYNGCIGASVFKPQKIGKYYWLCKLRFDEFIHRELYECYEIYLSAKHLAKDIKNLEK